jgi:hypothetical protein
MRSRFTLFAILALLVGGLLLLFHLRFQGSDLYPQYSSLRSDPRGLKILFEALQQTGAVQADRSFRPLEQWRGTNAAVVVAGVAPYWWLNSDENLQNAERLAGLGNRVVITLDEQARLYDRSDIKEKPLAKHWGVSIEKAPGLGKDEDREYRPWPFFFLADKNWRVVRRESGRPVLIERSFGSGAVALMATSWPLTNEAMVDDRQPEFLLTLLGTKPEVRFDESHLGMAETGTIMALARRFHLQGFLTGLFLVAALFIWRNTTSFPPQREQHDTARLGAGRDSLTGLAILLERHLPEKDLLACCLREREKAGDKQLNPNVVPQLESIVRTAPGATPGFASIQDLIAPKRKPL